MPSESLDIKNILAQAKRNKGFVSDSCLCHFVLPYGFVPEADCSVHDREDVVDALNPHAEKIVGDFD